MKESYSENSFSWHFVTKLFEEFIREKCTNFAIVEEIEKCQNFKTFTQKLSIGTDKCYDKKYRVFHIFFSALKNVKKDQVVLDLI